MSTILKALQRLEEEAAPSTSGQGDSRPSKDPRVADELRSRILAEESAARSAAAANPNSARLKRVGMIAVGVVLTLGLATAAYQLWPRVDSDSTLPSVVAAAPLDAVVAQPNIQANPLLAKDPEEPSTEVTAVAVASAVQVETPASIVAAPLLIPIPVESTSGSKLESSGTAHASASQVVSTPATVASQESIARGPHRSESDANDEISRRATSPAPATLVVNETPSIEASESTPLEVVLASSPPSRRPMPTRDVRVTPDVSAAKAEASSALSSSSPASSPTPTPTASSSPRPVRTESNTQPNPAGSLDRRGLPEITVLRTAWHPDADRRSTKIRLEATNEIMTLREGDAIGKLVIQSISPSSVLFRIGDLEIRRRVGQP